MRAILMIFFLLGIAGVGVAQPTWPSLQRLWGFYDEIDGQGVDLVDFNLYVGYLPQRSAEQARKDSETCRHLSHFQKTSPREITQSLAVGLESAIEIAFQTTQEKKLKFKELESILRDLRTDMAGRKLELCVDQSTPAYSDGHEVYFVRADGKTAFGFEIGSPD